MKERNIHQSLIRLIRLKRNAGLSNLGQLNENKNIEIVKLPTVNERVAKIMEMIAKKKKSLNSVFIYVIYDISNSKIRKHISNYLERNGLVRVQLSVFFGEVKRELYVKMKKTLKEINDMYENNDSIFIIPIGEDILNKTTIIGENIDFDIIVNSKSTLFI